VVVSDTEITVDHPGRTGGGRRRPLGPDDGHRGVSPTDRRPVGYHSPPDRATTTTSSGSRGGLDLAVAGPLAGGNGADHHRLGLPERGAHPVLGLLHPAPGARRGRWHILPVAGDVLSDNQITLFRPRRHHGGRRLPTSLATTVTLEFDDPASPNAPVDSAPASAGDGRLHLRQPHDLLGWPRRPAP